MILKIEDIQVGQILRVRNGRGHPDKRILGEGKDYEVRVVVRDGSSQMCLRTAGVILYNPTWSYPYVWDLSRFFIVD